MPTYEYRCPKGHEFERFYKTISGSVSQIACPECGALAGRMMSAGGGLMFKGSGFYLTDYGKNAHRGNAPKAAPEGGDSGGGKAESPTAAAPKADAPKAESTKPKAESPAPKAETPKSSRKKPKSE